MSSLEDVLDNPQDLGALQELSLAETSLIQFGFSQELTSFETALVTKQSIMGANGLSPSFTSAVSFRLIFSGRLRVDVAINDHMHRSLPFDTYCELERHSDGVITFECRGPGISFGVECRNARIADVRNDQPPLGCKVLQEGKGVSA